MSHLSEADKNRIEEEERYRAEVRDDLAQDQKPKKGGNGCLTVILIFVGLMIVGGVMQSLFGDSSSTSSSTKTEAEIKADQEKQLKDLGEISTTFCSERSQSNVRYVNLSDFIKMYEADGETVTLRPAGGVKPTADNCKKVADICVKKWDLDSCRNIAERKIWIGMDKHQLILSWGLPNDRNNNTYSFGTHSQWVYGLGNYVYLEGKTESDLKVTSWQD